MPASMRHCYLRKAITTTFQRTHVSKLNIYQNQFQKQPSFCILQKPQDIIIMNAQPPADSYLLAHDLNESRSNDVLVSENVTFEDLLLTSNTISGLRNCNFHKPSPIQLKTIPLGLCGFDLIVQSKAGTGKTCIFTLVALEALQFNPNNCTQTIIIAPTREIAIQIHEVISHIGKSYKNLRCALCIGGVEVKQDRANLKGTKQDTCQIVIGTPGRIKQLIDLNILQTHQVELLVLDEADKLVDEQFKNQIDDIYKRLPQDKQMIVTSATYPNELSQFLKQYMVSPKFIRVGADLSLEAVQEFYIESKPGHSGKKNLEHKFDLLSKLLIEKSDEFTKTFIFTNYQARAPMICDNLNNNELFAEKCGPTNYICAELSQDERKQVFTNFKQSNQKVLVSTDVSARGIDIKGIDLVINFDLPIDQPTYYHRIGRSGRFGLPGTAISIVSGDNIDKSLFKKSVYSEKIKKLDF